VSKIDDLLERLRDDSAEHDLHPTATEEDVRRTEQAIGAVLPASYRTFVRELSNGAYLYGVQGVAPVGDVEHLVPIHRFERLGAGDPNEALTYRDGGATVGHGETIVFGGDSNGNEWCFVTARPSAEGEYEVAYLDTGSRKLYAAMRSFAHWLEWLTEHPEDEVIRTYYVDDDEILYDEMMLG
jgi:hypothetical protein